MPLRKSYRPYTGTLHCTAEQRELLKQNNANWGRMCSVTLDRIATMLGSYFPAGEADGSHLVAAAADEAKIEVNVEECRTILAFINWFSTEQLTEHNKKYAISASTAVLRLGASWHRSLGPYSATVLKTLATFKLKEGASFIDRRKMFADSGLNPTFLQNQILSHLKFQGAFNENSKAWRNVISRLFGDGEKADPNWDRPLVNALIELTAELQGDLEPQSLQVKLAERGLWREENLTTIGAPPSYLKSLKQVKSTGKSITVADFRKVLLARQQSIEAKSVSQCKTPQTVYDFFIQSVEDLNLVPFNSPRGQGGREFYYSAYAAAWQITCSQRSNAVNRILAQLALVRDNEQLSHSVDTEIAGLDQFCSQMATKLSTNDYQIKKYQIREQQGNGLKEFLRFTQSMEIEAALDATATHLDVRALKFHNQLLLRFCVEFFGSEANADRIQDAIRFHYQDEQIKNGRLGCIADPLKGFIRPQYGSSKPAGCICIEDNKVRAKLRLLTNSGIQDQTFDVSCDRAEVEILANQLGMIDGETDIDFSVPRNTPHHNPYNKAHVLIGDPDISSSALDVYCQSNTMGYNNWSITIKPNLSFNNISLSMIQTPKVLGIDLGWREPAAYTILDAREVSVERGFLDHAIRQADDWSKSPKKNSVFSQSGEASQHVVKFYQRICKDYMPDKPHNDPKSFCYTIKEIVRVLKSALNKQITTLLLNDIEECVRLVSPYFVSYGPCDKSLVQVNQGKLSYERMEMMKSLTQMLSRLISKAENNKVVLDNKFAFMRERITRKMNNLRLERAKVIGRMILKKAIDAQCNIITCEDLSPTRSSRKVRRINDGVNRWFARRIIDFLIEESRMHGIVTLEVSPHYSSHEDIDGTPIARYTEINPQTLPDATMPMRFYPSKKSIGRRLDAYLLADIDDPKNKIYHDATTRLLNGESWEEVLASAKDKGIQKLFVPDRTGYWHQSNILGRQPSDIMASHVIAKRGFERWNATKNPSTARKSQTKSSKGHTARRK